ncbi:hypothetical protein NDU88_007445 [Pleurodeles waltl]|uniref:Uncharacterized protein n=1 Tax=Pleurodeles waltl TaxID=8319 RepID=A0AAV7U0P7_PLEWA|nr:hypothetical protein NDU88_007445 [Pleurodeles waltl]
MRAHRAESTRQGRRDTPGSLGPTAGPEPRRRGNAPRLRGGAHPLFCPRPAAEHRQVRCRLRPVPRSASSPQQRDGPRISSSLPGSTLTSLRCRQLVHPPSLAARIFRPVDGVRALH